MDTKLKQAYLYDFYGELLNEHQRKVYEDFFFHDLSLGEIAEEEGISRQGVYDLVKRCTKALEEYESKLHLVEKFLYIRERIDEILQLVHSGKSTCDVADAAQLFDVSDRSRFQKEGSIQNSDQDAAQLPEVSDRISIETMKAEIERISHEILEEL